LENLFPPKGSLVNAQQKERKAKEARKQKVKDAGAEILLSAHARISKAVIWHHEQKLV